MRGAIRAGAVCGILQFVLSMTAIGLVSAAGVSERQLEQGLAQTYLPRMAAAPALFVASMWLFNAASMLVLGFGVGLSEVLHRHRPWSRFALVGLFSSSLLFITETMMTLGIAQVLAPSYTQAPGDEKTLLLTTTLTLVEFRNHSALLAGVLLATATLIFGYALLETELVPRWLGFLALLAGVVGVLGGLAPWGELWSVARGVGVGLFRLWCLLLAIAMLRGVAPEHQAGTRANRV